MLRRKLLPVWIGIIVLSSMFLMGQDTWAPQITCPTGTYYDLYGPATPWDIETIGGNISGTHTSGCGTWTLTGTSNGTTITMRMEDLDTACCTIADLTLAANETCDTLTGTYEWPPESSCGHS